MESWQLLLHWKKHFGKKHLGTEMEQNGYLRFLSSHHFFTLNNPQNYSLCEIIGMEKYIWKPKEKKNGRKWLNTVFFILHHF